MVLLCLIVVMELSNLKQVGIRHAGFFRGVMLKQIIKVKYFSVSPILQAINS